MFELEYVNYFIPLSGNPVKYKCFLDLPNDSVLTSWMYFAPLKFKILLRYWVSLGENKLGEVDKFFCFGFQISQVDGTSNEISSLLRKARLAFTDLKPSVSSIRHLSVDGQVYTSVLNMIMTDLQQKISSTWRSHRIHAYSYIVHNFSSLLLVHSPGDLKQPC